MLGALRQLISNTRKLNSDKLLQQVLEPTLLQNEILDLNKEQLYEEGIRADGVSLGTYSAFTIQYKQNEAASLGRDTRDDHVTLKDTGAFYATFTLTNNPKETIIGAKTEKPDGDLAEEFGPQILGLDEKSKDTVKEWIRPGLRQGALNQIRG